MKKKEVQVKGHHPVMVDPKVKVGWTDVWIVYKTRPKRIHYYGPTLITKEDLKVDLEINKQCQAENPELDYSDDIKDCEDILQTLQHSRFVVRKSPSPHNTPDIFTSADGIDRKEAIAMLKHFMQSCGFNNVTFRWTRPKLLSFPI